MPDIETSWGKSSSVMDGEELLEFDFSKLVSRHEKIELAFTSTRSIEVRVTRNFNIASNNLCLL